MAGGMRVLVTGVTGFVGSYLAEHALEHGGDVWGAYVDDRQLEQLDHVRGRLDLIPCDLRDRPAVDALLAAVRPERVVHLAAMSSVATSWSQPADVLAANVLMQVNLLEAVRDMTAPPRILVAGSGEEYGWVERHELPVTEAQPLRPLSPYAVSKVAQDLMGYQYFKSYGMPIVRTRAFTHEGPRRSDAFAIASFARQIAEIEAGRRRPVLEVGNLHVRRDFTDVRDIVRGYWELLERGEPGEVYNLCSGRSWSIREVVEFLIGQARVDPIEVRQTADRVRPSDSPQLVGDPAKVHRAIGWQAAIPFERTLCEMLDHWRRRVMESGAVTEAARPG